MSLYRLRLTSAVLVYAVLVVASTPASAADWHDMSNYPARVVAFNFGSAVLDQNHPMRFGAWTVSFSGGLPIIDSIGGGAKWMTTPRNDENNLPFTCANSVSGEFACFMTLIIGTPGSNNPNLPDHDWCAVTTKQNGHDGLKIPIPCPTSITFQQ
jgi:hypothetical protein